MTCETIKKNFARGLWTVGMVAVAVAKGVITAGQFEEITGVVYEGE